MAEGLFLHLIKEQNIAHLFDVDSAGTAAYHVGEMADSRMRETAAERGVVLDRRARAFKREDLNTFDLILAMDQENYDNILSKAVGPFGAKVYKMGYFFDEGVVPDIPDPYYGGKSGFVKVFDMLQVANANMLEQLMNKKLI
jgi:protein-tyrosine phosphatase